jgi:flagellar hook-associated protein 2
MASISSAGIGSGLQVASLVAQLVAAEREGADTRLAKAESKVNTQLSALGTFRGALAGLQSAVNALKADGALSKLAATSSKPELFTASSSGASPGNYDIEVVSLARSHKMVSAAFGSAQTALGEGSAEITVGDKSFTVTLGPDANTLADLRDAINEATDNKGVTATLVNEAGGTRLLLTSRTTGTESQISIDSSLAAFTEKQAAADAHIRVEGYDHYAQTNSVTGAIDGVTLTLLKAEEGTVATLDVAVDTKAATAAIETFVKSYNAFMAISGSLSKYDASRKEAQPLAGDATVRGAVQSLRGMMGNTVSGAGDFSFLSEIGIKTAVDGSLTLDSAKLAEALSQDREGVQQLFGGPQGYATRLSGTIDALLKSDGQIKAKDDALKAQQKDIDKQQEALDERMARLANRYRAQFTSLDSLMAQMGSTSNYLTQQLANLVGSGNR